jgi:signal peptidase I
VALSDAESRRRSAGARQKQPAKSFALELVEVLLLAVGLYAVITFAIQTVHVVGYSMVPTLDNDDYVLATKIDLRFTHPQRGDIVILKDPFDNSQDFVKRVIALPGERLQITDSHIYINGRLLVEPYLSRSEPWVTNNNWPVAGSPDPSGVIPNDEYFVMGDNRNHSSDSRGFGPIAVDKIESRAWIRILPLDKSGYLGQRPYFAS